MSLHEHTEDEVKAKLFSGELGDKKTVVSARVRAMDMGVDIAGVTGSIPVPPTIVFRRKQPIVYPKEWLLRSGATSGATSCRFGLPRKTLIQKGSSMAREKLSFEELDHLEWLLEHNQIDDISEEMRALVEKYWPWLLDRLPPRTLH